MADEVKTPEAPIPEASKQEDVKVEKQEGEKTLPVSEVNRIVQERLAKERERSKAETDKAIDEAIKLTKMSAEDKAKELERKKNEELSLKEKELTLRENKLTGVEKLATDKIPTDFIEFLVDEDPEAMSGRIDTFRTRWSEAISQAVEERLKGTTPKDISNQSNPKETIVVKENPALF